MAIGLNVTERRGGAGRWGFFFFFFSLFWSCFLSFCSLLMYLAIVSERGVWVFRVLSIFVIPIIS